MTWEKVRAAEPQDREDEGPGYDFCECCGGSPIECECEWSEATVYDPDGNETGALECYCHTHRTSR